jgi:hypothetical protein
MKKLNVLDYVLLFPIILSYCFAYGLKLLLQGGD